VDEFAAMMDRDDGEEVGFGASQTATNTGDDYRDGERFDIGQESEMAPTQSGVRDDSKVYKCPMRSRGLLISLQTFKPLFED
jgi:hypothetical protein